MSINKKRLFGRIGIVVLLIVLAISVNQCRHEETRKVNGLKSDAVEVHFIDVGQGDSILIKTENSAMLIDAGENSKGFTVANYLKSKHIDRLDYVIGTHPHSDHIGGLDTIINTFPVGTVMLPDVSAKTRSFEDVLDAIEDHKLKITKPEPGTVYHLGKASFTILSPMSSSYEELNDYSIIIRLTNGRNSFLFTGDAGTAAEEELLEKGINLSADVLKIAHHGSITASSEDFLDEVNPAYSVISVGKDNDYGHPHEKILQSLKDRDIKVYRTDMQGTVVFTSDGNNISIN